MYIICQTNKINYKKDPGNYDDMRLIFLLNIITIITPLQTVSYIKEHVTSCGKKLILLTFESFKEKQKSKLKLKLLAM